MIGKWECAHFRDTYSVNLDEIRAHNDADHAARLRSILPTHAGFVAVFPEVGDQYWPYYEKNYQFLIDNVDTLGEREIKIRPDIEWEYEYRNVRLNESDVITYNETMAYIAPGTAVYEVTAYTDHSIKIAWYRSTVTGNSFRCRTVTGAVSCGFSSNGNDPAGKRRLIPPCPPL